MVAFVRMCQRFFVSCYLLSAKKWKFRWNWCGQLMSRAQRRFDRMRNCTRSIECGLPSKYSVDLDSFGLWHRCDCRLHRWIGSRANLMRSRPTWADDAAAPPIELCHPMRSDSGHSIRILHSCRRSLSCAVAVEMKRNVICEYLANVVKLKIQLSKTRTCSIMHKFLLTCCRCGHRQLDINSYVLSVTH